MLNIAGIAIMANTAIQTAGFELEPGASKPIMLIIAGTTNAAAKAICSAMHIVNIMIQTPLWYGSYYTSTVYNMEPFFSP
jgi:hypothetical protein